MNRIVAATAILALGMSAAAACDFQRTASKDVDKTVVASIDTPQSMSVPVEPRPVETIKNQAAKADEAN